MLFLRPATICAFLVIMAVQASSAAQQLPTGFVDELHVGGLNQPVGMAFLPDGRILVVEQVTNRVVVLTPSASGILGVVPGVANNHNEQGLLGIAVDPGWPTHPYIYLHYTHSFPPSIRLVRYTVSGDLSSPQSTNLSMSSPYFLINDIPDNAYIHNGGTLRFGPDGMLYMSIGDDMMSCSSQNIESMQGKILRMDVSPVHGASGSGPPAKSVLAAAGNPFTGPISQLVWAYGLRNPYRFNIDPFDGKIYIADVGGVNYEEMNVADAPGLNFGWPYFEGPAVIQTCTGPPGTLVSPVSTYPNPLTGVSIICFGGAYRNLVGAPYNFGNAYELSIFYVDFFTGEMWRLEWNGSVWSPAAPVPGQPTPQHWATGMGAVADAMQGPDGAIYYVKWAPGSIRRIRPEEGGRRLKIISGNPQTSNAGWNLYEPMVVELVDGTGTPVPGVPVTFSVLAGGGQLDPQPVTTMANGRAQSGFVLPSASSNNPIAIQAAAPGAPPLTFQVTWRGMSADFDPITNSLQIDIRHSAADVPFTLMAQPAPPALLGTAWGDIFVDILNPPPGAFAFDGLGMFGPPNPLAKFPVVSPWWSVWMPGIQGPPGGLTLVLQAFALDLALLPDQAAIMITNPVMLFLN